MNVAGTIALSHPNIIEKDSSDNNYVLACHLFVVAHARQGGLIPGMIELKDHVHWHISPHRSVQGTSKIPLWYMDRTIHVWGKGGLTRD